MKGQLNVSTPEEYIASLEEPRRSDIAALHALVRKHAPKLEPCIRIGILGYGPFRYKYESGREGESCRIGISSNATYISLYTSMGVAETFREALPKASIGKSCVRFRRMSDLDPRALAKLIKASAK